MTTLQHMTDDELPAPSKRKKALQEHAPLTDSQRNGDELVGTARLSAVLAVHPNTISSMIKAGRIPFSRCGRDYRFSVPRVIAALEESS